MRRTITLITGANGEVGHGLIRQLRAQRNPPNIVVLDLRSLDADVLPYVDQSIVGDILDVTGSDEELGKPSGSDERHGKLTYVSAYGLEEARELASESHQKARAALDGARPRTDHLIRITDFIHTRHT